MELATTLSLVPTLDARTLAPLPRATRAPEAASLAALATPLTGDRARASSLCLSIHLWFSDTASPHGFHLFGSHMTSGVASSFAAGLKFYLIFHGAINEFKKKAWHGVFA